MLGKQPFWAGAGAAAADKPRTISNDPVQHRADLGVKHHVPGLWALR